MKRDGTASYLYVVPKGLVLTIQIQIIFFTFLNWYLNMDGALEVNNALVELIRQ